MFKLFKRKDAAARLIEEQLYEKAILEAQRGEVRPGLWAKALANSFGDEAKAKSLYLKFRVQSMSDEVEIELAISEKTQSNVDADERIAMKVKEKHKKEQDGLERRRIKRLKRNARDAGGKYFEK